MGLEYNKDRGHSILKSAAVLVATASPGWKSI